MRGFEAREIIGDIESTGRVVEFSYDDSEVRLDGVYTIEELHAILHRMEYDD